MDYWQPFKGCAAAVSAVQSSMRSSYRSSNDWPSGELWDRWCLAGGEDFELVLSLPEAWAQRWFDRQPQSRQIGWITAEKNMIRWRHSRRLIDTEGFDHFRTTPIL
jgi:thiamine-monophosphate kinase